jgi:hypothetical protein
VSERWFDHAEAVGVEAIRARLARMELEWQRLGEEFEINERERDALVVRYGELEIEEGRLRWKLRMIDESAAFDASIPGSKP